MQDIKDSNEWDITVPSEGDLESKLRAIERQLANQVKEFIFILDLEGNNLYRAKGTNFGILNTRELQEVLTGRQVIVITHNHPSEDLKFSLADLDTFFQHKHIAQLRVTSGTQTAILTNENHKLPYSNVKMNIKMPIFKLLRTGKITQDEYDKWLLNTLPVELAHKLPLEITLITL